MDPASDLRFVAEQIRESFARASALTPDQPIPGLADALTPLAGTLESLAAQFAALEQVPGPDVAPAKPPAAAPARPADLEQALATPGAVARRFCEEYSPPPADVKRLIDSLIGDAKGGSRQARVEPPRDFSSEYRHVLELPPAPDARPPAYAELDIGQTPPPVIAALLQLGRVTPSDVVYHLGCGDGRLLISAASKFHARGVGVEDQAAAAEAARDNVRKARLQRLVTVEQAVPEQTKLAEATVVFLSLGAQRNSAVSDTLRRQLRPGVRVVTHQGGFPGWPPDEETATRDADGRAYRLCLWRVPDRSAPSSSITGLSGPEWQSGSA